MPFDDSQPFEVVDDNADFDPSKPFDVVGDSSEASEFDPGKPFSVVQPKESESGDTLRAPTRAEKIKGALRNISPNLFSTERTLIGDRPRGLIPALWEASKTSPLDTIPNIPEIKTNDGSIESKIENFPLNVAAGLGDFALGTARFFTSPQGMATSGVGGIGPIARRAIATVFTPLLTKQAAEKLGEASVTKDPRAAAEGAALALAAGGAGAHAVRGEPVMASAEPPEQPVATASEVPAVEPKEQPINPNELPQAEAEPLQSKEPVAAVPDEVAAEPVTPEPQPKNVEPANSEVTDETPEQPTSIEAINAAQRVKLSAPEGATALRGTDSKGRTSVQPISAVAKGNPFQGADIVKLESGTIDRSGKFKPIEGDVEVVPKSMGGQAPADPGEIAPAELAQLTQSITHLADASPATQPAKAFDMGRALSSVKESASAALNGLKTVSAYLVKKQEGRPVWNTFKDILGDRHLAISESVHNARKFAQRALKEIPDKELQDALSNWVDTGGDEALLRRGVEESPARYKAGYERALKLTPEQKVFAENLKNYFTARLYDAQKAGILEDGIENYIHRIYEKESAWKKSVLAELGSGVFTGKPALAKARVFQYDFEAEQAGLKPIKSFVKRVMAYDLALNKAIADRQYVKANMEVRMPDGRPAIDVAGLGSKQLAEPGDSQATFINPKWKPSDPETPKKYRGDYVSLDHPALRKWKWVSADDKGNPTFVQGDVLVHPDAAKFLKPVLQSSAIRRSAVGRAALNVGSSVKQTMLDLSLFHPVQIAIHGFEHRSFKPAPEIDFTRPEVRGLIKGGLVVGETSGRAAFDEGLSGSSLTKHIPWLGPKIVELKDWIFQSYIPRLKISTGLAALERNRKAYPELSEAELYHQTAEQMNHAFGELNYEMMGRSKTMQDVLRLTALAPDFLEARTKFVGDAFTKYGKEQATALAFGALGLYVLARVLNKMISGQYHMELENVFSVIYKGKAYGLRTVQGDLIHAATDPQHFIRNRLNPAITRPIMEAIVGRDEFGRKRSLGQQAVDYAKTAIPISVKGMFQGREKTLFESLLNSTGLTVRRATANTTIQKKLRDWTTENKIQSGPGEFIYDPDKDQYRKIRLAALEGDVDGTRKEIEAAVKAGVLRSKIMTHFSGAVTRPITGSRKNDLLFKQSLSDDDKATFEQARKERAAVYSIVRQASR